MLQAKEDAPEVDGLRPVEVLHAGLEQVLRVLVEADARIVDLRECRLLSGETRIWSLRIPTRYCSDPISTAHAKMS